jgi:hypothetical protein
MSMAPVNGKAVTTNSNNPDISDDLYLLFDMPEVLIRLKPMTKLGKVSDII